MKKYYNDLNYLNIFRRPKQSLLENRRKVAAKFEPFRTIELATSPQSDLEEIELDRYYQEIILSLLCEFKPPNQEILNLAQRHPNEMIELLLLENNVDVFDFIFSKLNSSPLLFMMLLKMTRSGLIFSLSDNLAEKFVHKQLTVLETLEEMLSVEKNKRAFVLFYECDYMNIISLVRAFASNQQLEVVKFSFLKFKETEIETRIKTCLAENRWVIVEGVCPYSEKRMERVFAVLEDLDRSFLSGKGKLIILVHRDYHSSFYDRSFKCLNMIHLTSCSSIKELLTSFYMGQSIECCVKATAKRRTLVKSTSAAQMIGAVTKKGQLKQLLPLVKFLGHLGKNASKDYTSCSLNKRPAPASLQSDKVQMDKYSFSLNFILSVYYKRQMIGETAKILPKVELLHQEISAISELASKIFSEYEIDPNLIIEKLISRFLGLDLKETVMTLNHEADVIRSFIRELIDNEGSRPVLLDVVGNKYEFFSPVETLPENQKSLMVTSVIGRYPLKDPFEILGMTFGPKLAYDFEQSQELYQNLILLEKKPTRNSMVERPRILSFLQSVYDSIFNLEEISVPDTLEERNVKLSPELLALANTSKQGLSGHGRPSLFSQRSKGDLKKSNFKPVILSQEIRMMGEYVLREGRDLNKILKTIQSDVKICIKRIESGCLNLLVSGIMENKIPDEWRDFRLLSKRPETCHELFEQLFIKYDYLSTTINRRKGISRLPLNLKYLGDPKHFIYKLFLDYCLKEQMNPKDVGIELRAVEGTQQDEQNKREANKLCIKGLELYFGGFDLVEGGLTEPQKLSFVSDLPEFYLTFTVLENVSKKEGQIPIIVKGYKDDESEDGSNNSSGSEILQNDQVQMIKIPLKPGDSIGKPQFWFYLKSRIPQEKWNSNGTFITL